MSKELDNCKKIGYEYFCEELFMVRVNIGTAVLAQCILILTRTLRKMVISIITTTKPM